VIFVEDFLKEIVFFVIMIFGRRFYTEQGKGNLERAKDVLVRDFSLVPGHDPTNPVLVWEDEIGIGRYRVHLYDNCVRTGISYECIQFQYWVNSRMKRDIFEADPMNKAVMRVRGLLEGKVIETIVGKDKSIDEVMNNL